MSATCLLPTKHHVGYSSHAPLLGKSKSKYGSSDESSVHEKPISTREGSFTISAIHGVQKQQSMDGFAYISLENPSSSFQQRENSPSPSTASPKAQPPEIFIIDKELARMFKLQLGPLTIGRDVEPVMQLWSKLQEARRLHGIKAVAGTWKSLSTATAIVARKMTIHQITQLINAQSTLMYPCPRSLRLPADMFLAIGDRARVTLHTASEEEIRNFCAALGRLVDSVTSMRNTNVSSEHWIRALNRVANVMPLMEAGIQEAARRGKLAVAEMTSSSPSSDNASLKTSVLLIAEILAELGGARLGAPVRCLNLAAVSAGEEVERQHAAEQKMTWWKKKAMRLSESFESTNSTTSSSSSSGRIDKILPCHSSVGTHESYRCAGEAAESLARFLVPKAVSVLNSKELERLASALGDATAEDESTICYEPLRQALGMVVEEAARRTSTADAFTPDILTKSSAQMVVDVCRKRLLHVKFDLKAPANGVPQALHHLQAWKSRMRRASVRPMHVIMAQKHMASAETKPFESDEKETTSLELLNSGGEEAHDEDGEEVASKSPS